MRGVWGGREREGLKVQFLGIWGSGVRLEMSRAMRVSGRWLRGWEKETLWILSRWRKGGRWSKGWLNNSESIIRECR